MATRNAWLAATADGRTSSVGLGPRAAGGWLSASLTLRTASGGISAPVELSAGGRDADSDTAHAYVRVPRGYRVDVYPLPNGGAEFHIVQSDPENPTDVRWT